MLIRRKSSTDDEYHHQDLLGNFGVITGANAAVLSSNVYDAFDVLQFAGESVLTKYISHSLRTMPDALVIGGTSIIVSSRNIQLDSTNSTTDGFDPWKCRFFCYLGCLTMGHSLVTCYNSCCVDKKKKKKNKKSGGSGSGSGGGGCPSGQNKVTITCGKNTETACIAPGQSACCSGSGVTIVNGPCPKVTASSHLHLIKTD